MTNAQEVIANDRDYFLQVYSRPDFVIENGEGCYFCLLYTSDAADE